MSDADVDAQLLEQEREHHMTMLRAIPQRRADLAERERSVVHYARQLGIGWDAIATAIGMSAGWQAQEKYGEPPPGAEPF